MEKTYAASVAKEVVGVSQRCLEYWDERRIVRPSGKRARGKGTERLYSFQDLVELCVVKRLRDSGLSLRKIQKGVEALRSRGLKRPLNEVLLTNGKDFFWKRGDKVIDLLAYGQFVFSIAVGQIREQVRKDVVKIPERKSNSPRMVKRTRARR